MGISGIDSAMSVSMRPSTPADKPFLERLHSSTRGDLRLIDDEKDFVESVIDMQFRAQTEGYGSKYPNAMYFIVEKQHQAIGKVTIDFGHNEVRLVDMAFIPNARGKGFGKEVLCGLQLAAAKIAAPLTLTVLSNNLVAKRLYLQLGFVVESVSLPYEFMAWYPSLHKVTI